MKSKANICLTLLALFIFALCSASPTTDIPSMAKRITQGAETKHEKAKRIYEWIAVAIKYDTEYKVFTAEEAMAKRRGVCQAITDLFCKMCRASGIDAEQIFGEAKEMALANAPSNRHAWAYFVGENGRKVLCDPTWATAGVRDGVVVSEEVFEAWFDASPEMMMAHHLPDDPKMQFIANPISKKEFAAMPNIKNIELFSYGASHKEILRRLRNGQSHFPLFYANLSKEVRFDEIGLERDIEAGKEYEIKCRITKGAKKPKVLIGNAEAIQTIKQEGNKYTIRFTPTCAEEVKVCLFDGDQYEVAVSYNVRKPTEEEEKRIEAEHPEMSKHLVAVQGIDAEALKRHGVSMSELLRLAKAGKVGKRMPAFTEKESHNYQIKDMPWDYYLAKGKNYTFRVSAPGKRKMMVANGKDQYDFWVSMPDGTYAMTITAKAKGDLVLYQLSEDGTRWDSCVIWVAE